MFDTDRLVAGVANALVTVHKVTGVVEILAGEVHAAGYVEGVGRAARFTRITGIAQLENEYIVSDYGSKCLRSVNYFTHKTETFAGRCGTGGTDDGSLLSARFESPRGITKDPGNPNVIYLLNRVALRKIDRSANTVITLPGKHLLNEPEGLAMNPAGGLLITSPHGVKQYDLNGMIAWLTGNDKEDAACDECMLLSARFDGPVGLRFITPEVLLVADRWNFKLRLVNLTSGIVTAIGAGKGHQDGPYQESKFQVPQGLAVDNSFIYIGEEPSAGGGVRKLAYSGMCDFLHRFNQMQSNL